MKRPLYSEEFKAEALKQISDRGYSVSEVSQRLGSTVRVRRVSVMNSMSKPIIYFVDRNPDVIQALSKAFNGISDISCRHGNILELASNCVVSPANSAGFMDGSID